jgi:hypothetical protein
MQVQKQSKACIRDTQTNFIWETTFRGVLLARVRHRETAGNFQRGLVLNSDIHTQELSGNLLIRHTLIPEIEIAMV